MLPHHFELLEQIYFRVGVVGTDRGHAIGQRRLVFPNDPIVRRAKIMAGMTTIGR